VIGEAVAVMEVESGAIIGDVQIGQKAFASGGKMVDWLGNGPDNWLELRVSTDTAGSYRLTIFYASAEDRNLSLSVNGGPTSDLRALNSGGWEELAEAEIMVPFTEQSGLLKMFLPMKMIKSCLRHILVTWPPISRKTLLKYAQTGLCGALRL